jgi:hypothetical protein
VGARPGSCRRRLRRLPAGHNVTPGEDYRTRPPWRACSIAHSQVFVIDSLIQIWGNDPDVKPVCGTPRAGCSTAGSFPPFILGQHHGTRTRARPFGRARGTIDPAIAPWRERQQANKTNNNTYTVADEIREGSPAFAIEIVKDFFLRLWLRGVDTVGRGVGTPVSTGLSICGRLRNRPPGGPVTAGRARAARQKL